VANVLKTLVNAPWSRNQLLVHLTLKGNFVYAAGDPTTNVDGEAFGVLKGATLDAQIPQSGDRRRGGNLDLWFWLVPDAPLNGIVVGVLATPAGALAAAGSGAVAQVVSLVVDRAKLAELAGATFTVDTSAQPNLDQARQMADSSGMAQQQLRFAIDDRLAGAADLFAQELGQIGLEATFVPLPAATIGGQPSTLLGQGFVAVVTTPDVVAQANQTTAGVLPPTEQVTL
jgi:hypothetical protein